MEKGRIRSPSSLMARPCAQTSCSRWEHAHTAWQSRCCLQQLPFYSLFHMVCLPPCVDSRILHKSQLLPSSLFHTCLFLTFLPTGCYSSHQGDSICHIRIPCYFVLWKPLQVCIIKSGRIMILLFFFFLIHTCNWCILYMCLSPVNHSSTRWPSIVRRFLVTSSLNSLWKTSR